MTATLFTFGYEGLTIDEFIRRLKEVGVTTVFDVRALPLSRKRGFSKTSLSATLQKNGVLYAHLPAMGCPKFIRERYKKDRDWKQYTRDFLLYLETQTEAVAELARLAGDGGCCLVCFEADFRECHRTYVARAAAANADLAVSHVAARTVIPDVGYRRIAVAGR